MIVRVYLHSLQHSQRRTLRQFIVQRSFKVIEIRMRLSISFPLYVYVCLLSFSRYNDLLVKNQRFSLIYALQSHLKSSEVGGGFSGIVRRVLKLVTNNWSLGLPNRENCIMILRLLVLIQYQRVTDRQTDTPPLAKSRSSIAECDK